MKNFTAPKKEINFCRELYSLKAIKLAVRTYQDLADFSLQPKKKYVKVILKNIKPEVADVLVFEFSNYVLSLMKKS